MDLNKLYKMQAELDKHILEKHNIKMSKEELLDNTILALLVEVGELANTTRCFKHWSTKGMMEKEIILDELADVIHFYLSIGNQMDVKSKLEDFGVGDGKDITGTFISIYYWALELDRVASDNKFNGRFNTERAEFCFEALLHSIQYLWKDLNFTDKEVEQAYLRKHEENYKRQREGY